MTMHSIWGTRSRGTLVTIKRDGRPQLSVVDFTADPDASVIRFSTTDDRVKTRNMRRDPRVSFFVGAPDGWAYSVAEGTATLTPVAAGLHDATVEELIDVYRSIAGEHPDWDDYRRAMVTDRRLVVRIQVDRTYGTAQ
ncbi:MAG TPA: PPOX class F420-dependent oxidoreductase [Micromonosporaceae bacterium]|nr:PPOX class F420-dependent oxidoreductase [Micromonosporaceae bacterium]